MSFAWLLARSLTRSLRVYVRSLTVSLVGSGAVVLSIELAYQRFVGLHGCVC